MNNITKISFAFAVVTTLAGCASGPDRMELAEQQAEPEQLRYEQAKADATGIYGVGTAKSNDLQVALKKARLTADFELAQQLQQELSGLEKDFSTDSNGSASVKYQAAVERFVSAVPMAGQEVAEQEVVIMDGKYNAFVLSRLSFDQMDRMLERRMTAAEDLSRMKQAFAELRERVAESKAPAVADDTAAQ